MGQLALPILGFSIFAIVVWAMLDERRQDKRDAAADVVDGRRGLQKPSRGSSRRTNR